MRVLASPARQIWLLAAVLAVSTALLVGHQHASGSWQFLFAALALLPLSWWLGELTEELAEQTTIALSALLSATLGNATELIVSWQALRHGHPVVVLASLIGSVLSNLLLVLGLAAIIGGRRFGRQPFPRTLARRHSRLLLIACVGLGLPSLVGYAAGQVWGGRLGLLCALCLAAAYAYSIVRAWRQGRAAQPPAALGISPPAPAAHRTPWSKLLLALAGLALVTVAISLVSDELVGALTPVQAHWGLSETFMGIVVIALVGNAAEHAAAIRFAAQNKMELAMSVTVGSSLQVALFIVPLVIFGSYLLARPLPLLLPPLQLVALLGSAWLVHRISRDGVSEQHEGWQLFALYVLLAAAFYFHA